LCKGVGVKIEVCGCSFVTVVFL